MDQFWIYVIIGIIYVISRALKKPDNQPKDGPGDFKPSRRVSHDPTPPVTKPKPMSFEDLLREITEAKQPSSPAYPARRNEPEVVDYDDDIEEEAKDLEEVSYSKRLMQDDRSNSVYEEAKRQAFQRPSLEETLNVRDTNVQFGKFKVFEKENQRNLLEEYTKDFQDPEGFKKAVILSEILKPKF